MRYDYDSFQPDIESICPDYGLKLCLNVTDRTVYFRDLYALSSWEAESESDIKIDIENGNYEIIVCSWLPQSGIRGDNQQIDMYFNKLWNFPNYIMRECPLFYMYLLRIR